MLCRGTNRYMDEAFVPKSEYNNASRELITEKEVEAMEPCSTDWKQSRTEETRAEGSHCPEEPAGYTTSTIAVRGRNWEIVHEFGGPQPPLKTAISKFVMKLLRHCDQEERDSDGAMHWDSIHSRLLKELGTRMGLNCSQRDWLQAVHEGSNKTRFEYCKNSRDSVMYVRAIQGHTGRNTKSSCSTEGVLTIRNLSWTNVSLLEKERNKVEDSQFSSHRSIFLKRI